jgi:hypothetical protein
MAESKKREAQDELTDKHDQAQREVWSGFIAFRTAQRQKQAAVALLDITSLIIQVGTIAFVASRISVGSLFNYLGLQIAFAFYLVALLDFSASTELAPARDRFVGILFAVIVMWFVFDQIWPVRTVTAMRRVLASVLRSGPASFC